MREENLRANSREIHEGWREYVTKKGHAKVGRTRGRDFMIEGDAAA